MGFGSNRSMSDDSKIELDSAWANAIDDALPFVEDVVDHPAPLFEGGDVSDIGLTKMTRCGEMQFNLTQHHTLIQMALVN